MKRFFRKYILTLLLLIGIISTLLIQSNTTSAAVKTALLYGVKDSSFNTYINTYPEVDSAKSDLSSIGYSVTVLKNKSSSTIFSSITDADVFMISCHGDPGRMYPFNGSSSMIFPANAPNAFGNNFIDNLPSNSLSDMEVAVYGGCYTANTSSVYGNLLNSTYNKGAKFVLGWKVATSNNQHTVWLKVFMESLSSGNNVSKAIVDADDEVYDLYYNNHGGTLRIDAKGNYAQKID